MPAERSRRREPAAEIEYGRACVEGHERGIADLERAIADRRKAIEDWRVIIARLEAQAGNPESGDGR